MRRYSLTIIGMLVMIAAAAVQGTHAAETFTGTVVSFPERFQTRTRSASFTLIINNYSDASESQRFLNLLQEGGQDTLLKAISKQEHGRFSVGPRVGVDLNYVTENMVDGRRRIFAVFERWTHFAELRYGLRSQDYPFGVIEIYVDPKTGKGEGTYIAAAKIRWDRDDKSGEYVVEVENFATFPARLVGVTLRGWRA